MVKSGSCGRALTGSAFRGRNGKRHFYYHCQLKCKERFKADEANNLFEDVLKEFVIKQNVLKLYKEILDETFSGERKDRKLRIKKIEKEMNTLNLRMKSIEEKFFDDTINISTYNRMKGKTRKKLNDLETELANIKVLDKYIGEYFKARNFILSRY